MWTVECADVLDWAREYDGPKFHAMLCDPPYHLIESSRGGSQRQPGTGPFGRHKLSTKGFMSKEWDGGDIAYRPETWAALAQHLHPGAWIMAFASTRGYHRLAVAMEDSGLIIQPSLFIWLNAQSFPKSTRINVGKASGPPSWSEGWTLAEINEAWQGHRYGGQILKNCAEPVICAQVPWQSKRLDCIVNTGAGALNVDGGRISTNGDDPNFRGDRGLDRSRGGLHGESVCYSRDEKFAMEEYHQHKGRWPPNFCLTHDPGCQRVGVRKVKGGRDPRGADGKIHQAGQFQEGGGFKPGYESEHQGYADADNLETVADWRCTPTCPVYRLGRQSGERPTGRLDRSKIVAENKIYGRAPKERRGIYEPSTGTAARFFHQSDWSYEIAERLALADPVRYQAKASRRERDAGLGSLAEHDKAVQYGNGLNSATKVRTERQASQGVGRGTCRNPHPTVKPIALTRWLATLLLPPPEYAPRRLLVPFGGTNSEGIGGLLAGWDEVVMVDNSAEYCHIAEARTKWWAGWSKQANTTEPKDILKAGRGQPNSNGEQLELL